MAIQLYTGDDPRRGGSIFAIEGKIHDSTGHVFDVQERISSGANGAVHRCLEEVSGDEYAVKFQLNLKGKRRLRFMREVATLRAVRHDHLVAYQGEGQVKATTKNHNGRTQNIALPFVVMELADRNLGSVVGEKRGKLEYEYYIGQFRGLSSALAALHEKAIHRDIKPENILVSGDRWILSDMGLCALLNQHGPDLTRQSEAIGPRYWMSPEAVNRAVGTQDQIIKASDVFQLASVFWYVVNGRHPSGIVGREHWHGPEELFKLVQRCLNHDPAARPGNGQELAQQLEAAVLGHSGLADPAQVGGAV